MLNAKRQHAIIKQTQNIFKTSVCKQRAHTDEQQLENKLLIQGRALINQNNDPKKLLIRNLVLQINNKWVSLDQNNIEQNWLASNPALIKINYNIHSLPELKDRSFFANCLTIESNIEVICLSEMWLTSDILDKAVFLPYFDIYQTGRPTHMTVELNTAMC